MSQKLSTNTSVRFKEDKHIGLILLFIAVAIIGLFYVKWSPYYSKAFLAASKHAIGKSIISGETNIAPVPSIGAAVSYMAAYFKAVWKAVILGLLLGSLMQIAIPRNWIQRFMGKNDLKSSAAAGAAALPGMMCSCCAAPVTVGLKKSSASTNAALAFFLANPVLNPATIVFMGFVLGWNFAVFRIVIGLALVIGISMLATKFTKDEKIASDLVISKAYIENETDSIFIRWIKALGQLVIDTIPAYIIVVALLGFARAWLFPAIGIHWGNSVLVIIGFAITGTLFVIPTAAEIPIVQTLMSFGLGAGPAAALLITLPAVSLPSLLIVKRAFPARLLVFVGVAVAVIGILSGFIGMAVL